MFLSIIIPVYKVEPYLRECLDSIASSPLDCWEVILIDDGSPDGCPQICDEYAAKDKRFRVIHQGNAGVAAARNAGLDVARGEWAWFVDSDDVVDMRPVGKMVEWLQEHQEVDLVMFDLDTFKDGEAVPAHQEENENVLRMQDEQLSKNDFLLKHICYHHPRLWYHRRGWWYEYSPSTSAVSRCGEAEREADVVALRFTHGIRLAEDLEFQYKYLTLCHRPVKFNVTLYHYRLREGSATMDATYRSRAVEDLPIVLNNLALWTKEHQVMPEAWYDYRIMKLLQNLLYSASLVNGLDVKTLQGQVKKVISTFRALGFPFVNNKKIRLAEWSVRGYFMLNKIYLKIKGLE